ncbi:nucleoside hydrolase [Streptomyces sp. NPDC087425]|uniref:nucleoside hydrolase n=1 Tax=Streptomyces sp. NPDC087425 TaxID=3365787 RepID=UPI003822ED7A
MIDTDPGIDDAFAVTLAARSPHVDLRAITTVFGNAAVEQTTLNALRVSPRLRKSMCGATPRQPDASSSNPTCRRRRFPST